MKQPETTVPAALPRTVVYSPETIAAYATVIETGLRGSADDMLVALRNLATMVHCDFTGELRAVKQHDTANREKPFAEQADTHEN